jgi:NAD(P) transhydrogenase subunit beta
MITPLSYLVASVCFILALQALSSPTHARRGNAIGAFGMLVAVVGTLILSQIITFKWIIPALILGSLIGAAMSIWIPMTKMPERIALSHSFGGLAASRSITTGSAWESSPGSPWAPSVSRSSSAS